MGTLQESKNLDKDTVANLVQQARDFAVTNGILMIPKDSPAKHYFGHAPFTLFPSFFPRKLFQESLEVQKDFNILVDKVSKDFDFIRTSLESVIKFDNFTKKLLEIQDVISKEGASQKISFCIIRSDYMLNQCHSALATNGVSNEENWRSKEDFEIKQIEINTIAASFAGLASRLTDLHRYVQNTYEDSDNVFTVQLPDNGAIYGLAAGITKAWSLYGKRSAIVLFVCQRRETNRVDQRILEYSIRECNPAIKVVFKHLGQVEDEGELRDDKSLLINGKEIAVAYFRAGYTPSDYYSQKEWNARLKLERSRAIKCPSVAYQLVGTKKIQQVLAKPGILERFLDDPVMIKRIRKTFAGLYSLDLGPEGDKNVEMAKATPERYVVKPQREGGGNNIYGEDICKVLEKDDGSRAQYILMEKIAPPVLKNYIVQLHKHEIEEEDVVCELGIFGFVISDGDIIVSNDTVGHLLRTKSIKHNDGGVAALRAVLDSPYLI